MPQTFLLDKVRRLILLKTGIKTISPSDCRFISLSIQKETQKNISETTLKRLFGFAEVRNKFSKYTINTLLEYVEKRGNYVLMEKELLFQANNHERFSNIQLNAIDITLHTLKHIKNRSSVPYQYTMPRFFARLDLEYFYDSDFSFTAFVSQAGYGKSILLSHLVQELFLDIDAKYKKDTILLVNAADIFDEQNEYSNIEHRIKTKIGLNQQTDLLGYFKDRYDKLGTKLIIIIDGFSELSTNHVSKPMVFDKLINLISNIEDEKFVKIVFSMRSTTWSRFYDRIKNVPYIKQKWFPGTYFNLKQQSNIPPLTDSEVDEILKKIEPNRANEIDPSLKGKLAYPFYIQWYYLLKEELPDFDSFTNIIFFEIIDRFIHEKIYHAAYATEKILFCKRLIVLSNYGKGKKSVPKMMLIADLSHFKNAYRELLADGILMEEKLEEDGFIVDFVRFIQPHVFEYFLFVEMISTVNNQMDSHFFDSINTEYASNPARFQLIQWSARLLIIQGKLNTLTHLLHLKLNNYEKTYLIFFIAENLNYRLPKQPQLKIQLQDDKIHQMLMDHIIHFDFVDSYYVHAVTSLSKVCGNDKYSFLYLVILCIYDCLSLKKDPLEEHINALAAIKDQGALWPINPYPILVCIYQILRGNRCENSELAQEIENFKNTTQQRPQSLGTLPGKEEMFSFILMVILNTFMGKPSEAMRLINALITYYPKMMLSEDNYSAYLFSIMSYFRAKVLLDHESELLKKIRLKVFHLQSIGNSTPFIQSIYLASKAYESRNGGDHNAAILYAERCIEIYQRNRLALIEIVMLQLLTDLYAETSDNEKRNQYLHQQLTLLHDRKIDATSFHLISKKA